MDRKQMAKEILATYNDGSNWDERDKIGSVALVVMALNIAPTESEWRDYLLIAGLNIFNADTREACIDATNFYSYSGMLYITPEEDSWINPSHPHAAEAVYDEEFARKVMSLRKDLEDALSISL